MGASSNSKCDRKRDEGREDETVTSVDENGDDVITEAQRIENEEGEVGGGENGVNRDELPLRPPVEERGRTTVVIHVHEADTQ